MWHDLKYAVRVLLKAPGFTLVALLSLSLGIGVNTATFSLLNTVLLRPLPVERPEQLIAVWDTREFGSDVSVFSYPNYVDLRDRNGALSGLAAFTFAPVSLSRSGSNQRLWGYLVSGNYFDVLGVRAVRGRTFLPEEDRAPGSHPVVVITYGCWQRRFAADPQLVGQTITLNGHSFTVAGIAPEGFQGTERAFGAEIFAPMMMAEQIQPGSNWLQDRDNSNLLLVGRLKPGVTASQAGSALNIVAQQLAKDFPQANAGMKIVLGQPGLFFPSIRGPILGLTAFLLVVVALVLLLACNNLANLLLARASQRRKEIAVRLALGAARMRLVRQLLTESVLLSVGGGALGLLIASWTTAAVEALKPALDFNLVMKLPMDYRVFGFTFLLSLATGVFFGVVPALQAVRADVNSGLREGSSQVGPRRSRLRYALVVTQMAMSLLLLVATGLMVRSLHYAQQLNPGFNPHNAVAVSFDLGLQGYNETRRREFQRQVVERVSTLPGVRAAALTGYLPLGLNRSSNTFFPEGRPPVRSEDTPAALFGRVSPGYFAAMETPLVEGRDFTQRDDKDAPLAVIVNETLAHRYLPGPSAVGTRIHIGAPDGPLAEVVGVARDGKYLSLGEAPRPFLFAPLAQGERSDTTLVVRTTGDSQATLPAIRAEVQRLDEGLPLYNVMTLTEHMGVPLFQARVTAGLLGFFSLLALSLAAIGLYGVMAFVVSQRTREIGIRMALGARTSDVLAMVLRLGLILTAAGLGLGAAVAFPLARLMGGMLYGISPRDPATFLAVPLFLVLVALLACYVRARRASHVDPMTALRHE